MKKIEANCGSCGFAENEGIGEVRCAESVRKPADNKAQPQPESIQQTIEEIKAIRGTEIYPIEALGEVLGGAAKVIAAHVQAPVVMAGQSVLSAAALVTQGHANVSRGNIGVCPTSLFFSTVAESGDRKSSGDKLALAPIRAFEEERINEFNTKKGEYEAELTAWEVERESVLRMYKRKNKVANYNKEMLENDLRQLEKIKPKPPTFPNIVFAEPTPAALWRHYQDGLPTAGLFSDEGIGFFSGHGMRDESKGLMLGELCKLWDGSPLTRTRGAMGESGVMSGRRLSAHLMIQPVVASKFLGDALINQQGFLPRFLIAYVESIAGTRFLGDKTPANDINTNQAYTRYTQRLGEILETPLPIDEKTGALKPTLYTIEGEAYNRWVSLHDEIEGLLAPEGKYHCVKAMAAKGGEMIARIATIFAFIEGAPKVEAEHISRAGQIVQWHLETMAARHSNDEADKQLHQAASMLEWLANQSGVIESVDFKNLPSGLRSAGVARARLKLLEELGYVEVVEYNTQDKPSVWKVCVE